MCYTRRVQRGPDGQMRRGHPNGADWTVIPDDYFGSLVHRVRANNRDLLDRLAQMWPLPR